MSLVDDEHNVAALAGEVVERGAELRRETHGAVGRFNLQGEQDLAVEGGNAEVGVRQVDHGVDVAVEGVGESTDGGGFTGTDIPGQECRRLTGEGVVEAALGLLVATRGVEMLGGNGPDERQVLKAIELINGRHLVPPLPGEPLRLAR